MQCGHPFQRPGKSNPSLGFAPCLAESLFEEDPKLSKIKDHVEDSGEGRWMVQTAIDLNVPAPVITLSLLSRLRSRQPESFGMKVLAGLRNRFGGHGFKTK